jgi:hypothetical protein
MTPSGGQSGSARPVDGEVARLAAHQHGVVSTQQLLALGMTRKEIHGRSARGSLHSLHRGVYAVGHRKLTRDGHLQAALLAAGDGAFLSHRTAAALHGLRNLNLRHIDVTVPHANSGKRSGVVIHRVTRVPGRGEITDVNGLPLSTVPRTLIDLASLETVTELDRLITEAARRQILNHDRMEELIARHARRPGLGKLKLAYADYRPWPDRNSGLERSFDRVLAKHPEIPEPLRNFWLGPWELDHYWPEQGLVLELDGRPYHIAVRDMERDRFRDAQLLRQGIRTLRITDRRYNDDPEGAIDDLKAALAVGTNPAGNQPVAASG